MISWNHLWKRVLNEWLLLLLKIFKSCLSLWGCMSAWPYFLTLQEPQTLYGTAETVEMSSGKALSWFFCWFWLTMPHPMPHSSIHPSFLLQSPESMPLTRWRCPRHPRLTGCHLPLYHPSSCSATWPRPTTPTDRVSGWGTAWRSITPGGKRSTRNTSKL